MPQRFAIAAWFGVGRGPAVCWRHRASDHPVPCVTLRPRPIRRLLVAALAHQPPSGRARRRPDHQVHASSARWLFYLSEGSDLDEFASIIGTNTLELYSSLDSESTRAMAAIPAGALANVDPEAARPMIEEALGKSVELGMPYVTSRMRGFLAGIDASSGRSEQAARHLFEAIEEAAATGSWFSAWGWMHRLVLVLASVGNLEDAVVLHHAIPAGRSMVWAGDNPDEILTSAAGQLGARRYAELTQEGNRMQRANLIPWIRDVIRGLEPARPAGVSLTAPVAENPWDPERRL